MSDGPAYYPLRDILRLQRGTTYKSPLLGSPGPVLLGLGTIKRNGGFRSDSLQTYGGESPEKLLVRSGELYVSLKDVTQAGDLLGAVARLPQDVAVGRLTQDTVKLAFDEPERWQRHVYWCLRTPEIRTWCRAHATGTTNLGLPREDFLALEVPAADRDAEALVNLLEAIEERIDINRQISQTLEELASAQFKSWFIDFDPVVAKQGGSKPFGMDDATAALFPKEIVGDLPQQWALSSLRKEGIRTFDGPHATPPEATSGAVFLGIRNMPGRSIDLADIRHIDEADWPRWTKRVTPKEGDIVFTYEAAVGRFALIPPGLRCCLGRRMALVRPQPEDSTYLYQLFVSDDFQGLVAERTISGSTVDRIALEEFPDFPILMPPAPIRKAFSDLVKPWWNLIHANNAESQSLTALRDLLLPQLLSGEIRIRDAAKLVEAAL